MADTTTLRAMLTLSKPKVSYRCTSVSEDHRLRKRKQAILQQFPRVDNPRPWSDFDAETLTSSHGHVLDHSSHAAKELAGLSAFVKDSIGWEEELTKPADTRQLISWNNAVLQRTLDLSITHVEQYTCLSLEYCASRKRQKLHLQVF